MKRRVCLVALLGFLGLVCGERLSVAYTEVSEKGCFFLKSLHFTAKGMEYWYSKEKGGLELITGVPYSKLACGNCHVTGCDQCHREEKGKHLSYTIKASQKPAMCLKCHAREQAMMRIDIREKQEDVHLAKGMSCTDCHSRREMHGDGISTLP